MKQVASFAGWAGTCVFFSKNKAIADHAALEDVRWKGPLQRGSSMGLHSYIVLSRCFSRYNWCVHPSVQQARDRATRFRGDGELSVVSFSAPAVVSRRQRQLPPPMAAVFWQHQAGRLLSNLQSLSGPVLFKCPHRLRGEYCCHAKKREDHARVYAQWYKPSTTPTLSLHRVDAVKYISICMYAHLLRSACLQNGGIY